MHRGTGTFADVYLPESAPAASVLCARRIDIGIVGGGGGIFLRVWDLLDVPNVVLSVVVPRAFRWVGVALRHRAADGWKESEYPWGLKAMIYALLYAPSMAAHTTRSQWVTGDPAIEVVAVLNCLDPQYTDDC